MKMVFTFLNLRVQEIVLVQKIRVSFNGTKGTIVFHQIAFLR